MELFVRQQLFRGPVPPPDLLKEYAQVDKFIPDRLISMAEREQANRHLREDKAFDAGAAAGQRAQVCATTIAVMAVIAAVPISIWGNPATAALIGIGGVIGHLVPALTPQRKQRPENEDPQD